jgi:molecular chaperone DnaK
VSARNNADAMVHATRSSLKELGDKIGDDDRKKIEAAIADVEEAIKGDDKDAIEAAINSLAEAAQVIHQQASAEAQAAQEGAAEASGGSDGDVVDAEFEEVDEDQK